MPFPKSPAGLETSGKRTRGMVQFGESRRKSWSENDKDDKQWSTSVRYYATTLIEPKTTTLQSPKGSPESNVRVKCLRGLDLSRTFVWNYSKCFSVTWCPFSRWVYASRNYYYILQPVFGELDYQASSDEAHRAGTMALCFYRP